MKQVVVDAGPFIHLSQINQITLLKKFPILYTPASVISEINPTGEIPIHEIQRWKNFKIVHIPERAIPEIESIAKKFRLHRGEKDVLSIAHKKISSYMVFTDDLDARNACDNLGIEVHGTVGIIAYAFHNNWISFKKAEESLILLQKRSSLFITFAIIERAIAGLKKRL